MFLTSKFLVGTFCFARKNLAALAVFRNISIGSHRTLFSESIRLSQTTFLKMPPKRNTRKASKEQPIEETEILNEGAQEEENPKKTKSKTSKKQQIEETKMLNEGAQEEDKPKRTKGRAAKEQAIEETEVLDEAQEEDKLKRNKTKASKEQPTEEMNGGAQQKDKPKQTKTKAAKKQPIEETEMEGAQEEDNPKRTKSKASKKQPIEETENLNVGAQEEDKPKRSKRQATKKDKEVEEEDPKVEKSKVNKKKSAEEESSSKTSKRKAAKQESVIKEKKAKKETEDEDKTDDEIAESDYGCSIKNLKGDMPNFKITSWNVAGLRAWVGKKGMDFIKKENPDVFCLQETKCNENDLPEEMKDVEGYPYKYFAESEKKGYAGIALYLKTEPLSVKIGLDGEKEGRFMCVEFENFYLINVYVPNAGRKLVTLDKRLEWNKVFKNYVVQLDEKKPVILCGDMNVAHEEIDLKNPKTNKRNAGFTQEERDGMTEFLEEGFVDTFRRLYPEDVKYTFWSYMGGARAKDVGWRLDYFLVSDRIFNSICDTVMRTKIMGSDHCPITLHLNV